jgi:hypothetical protein
LLTLEAEGSYDSESDPRQVCSYRGPMKSALDKLQNVPVDIEPVFPLASKAKFQL